MDPEDGRAKRYPRAPDRVRVAYTLRKQVPGFLWQSVAAAEGVGRGTAQAKADSIEAPIAARIKNGAGREGSLGFDIGDHGRAVAGLLPAVAGFPPLKIEVRTTISIIY